MLDAVRAHDSGRAISDRTADASQRQEGNATADMLLLDPRALDAVHGRHAVRSGGAPADPALLAFAAAVARQRAGRPVVQVEDAFVGILAEESGVHATDITDYVQDPPVRPAADAL